MRHGNKQITIYKRSCCLKLIQTNSYLKCNVQDFKSSANSVLNRDSWPWPEQLHNGFYVVDKATELQWGCIWLQFSAKSRITMQQQPLFKTLSSTTAVTTTSKFVCLHNHYCFILFYHNYQQYQHCNAAISAASI